MFKESYFDDRENKFKQSFVGENDINMNIDVDMINANMNQGAMPMSTVPMMAMPGNPAMGLSAPIVEPMRERVVNRTIMHEVPHICPNRTRIINNHVYRHTYQPAYSCCEENVVSNVQCGSCCNY